MWLVNQITPVRRQDNIITSTMAFKFIAFFACVAMASAGALLQAATPLAAIAQPVLAKTEAFDPNPQYSFGYDVQDAISGDNKNQVESRDGDVVHGQYSLNDADGYRRIVDYSADPLNGFNAVVRREPLGAVAVKTVAAAPTLLKAAPAPVAYAAAPTLIKSAPAQFSVLRSGPLIKSAQLAYAAPAQTLLRTAASPLAYAAAPSLIHAAPAVSYAAAAPALLRSQTLYKSAPVISYAPAQTLARTYAAAPAVAYAGGIPAVVKTSFASPLVSYAY